MMRTLSVPVSQQQNPNRLESTRKPQLYLLEGKTSEHMEHLFYNDDYTPMDFVQFVLVKIFRISTEDALSLTFAVHTQGKGVADPLRVEVERA